MEWLKIVESQGLAVAIVVFACIKGSQWGERFILSFNKLADESVKQTEVLRGIQLHMLGNHLEQNKQKGGD